MPRFLSILLLIALLSSCARSRSVHYDTPQVRELVEQLVSPTPPKYLDMNPGPEIPFEDLNGYMHARVAKARERLVAMGTAIYPELAKHHGDSRYSFSIVAAGWLNLSVGHMIEDIMAAGIEVSLHGYKSRANPNGSNGEPTFLEMVRAVGIERYAGHAKTRSKTQLQKEYIEWRIQKERSYGFVSPQQERDCLGPYLKRLSDL